MKKNVCKVLVVILLLTTVFAVFNLDSLLDAFNSMSSNSDSKSGIVNAKANEENHLSLELDRDKAQVGEIILAKVKAHGIDNLVGFQVNIKYDPEILEAVNPDTGVPMGTRTMPKDGDILVNEKYSVITMASNKVEEGILNFGKSYTFFNEYKKSGENESTGTLAVIGFKVLKEEAAYIGFEDTPTMPNGVSGTLLYNCEGERITGYTASQPCMVNGKNSDRSIFINLDKSSAKVGDVIKAVIEVNDIDFLSAYHINIKYDPEFLQPVNPSTLVPFESETMPEDGTLLVNEEYGPFSIAVNDLEEGILNFGKSYSLLNDYRMSGNGEGGTGTLGTIGFKVLKEGSTSISFANSITMPDSISGTMLYDWKGDRITDYLVIQPEVITISGSSEEPVETPDPITPPDRYIHMRLDKTSAKVGEIIKAYIDVRDITNFAAYQLNIKYDPNVLRAVDANTGEPFDKDTVPGGGDILANAEYGIVPLVDNDTANGILNFGKAYSYMEEYRKSGMPEESGTIAVIGFEVLSEKSTNIRFENTSTMPNSISGTYLYNWNGERLTNYTIIQPKTINGSSGILEDNISMMVDKNSSKAGEIITVSFLINNVDYLAGYQLNLKYDPKVLEPVQSSGEVYKKRTMPEGITVINNDNYSPITVVSNDLEKGKLCFGKVYLDMNSLKNSGFTENSGVLGEISFRVLSEEKTEISFERIPSVSGNVLGALIFDWDGNEIQGLSVQESVVIN